MKFILSTFFYNFCVLCDDICTPKTRFSEPRFSEILDLVNELQLPFSYLALEYCAEEGPMKMPYYSNHFESLGICKTIGGPNSGKPCIFPFIWKNFTEKGETFYGKLYEYIILKSFKILNILTYIIFRLSRRSKWKTLVFYKS